MEPITGIGRGLTGTDTDKLARFRTRFYSCDPSRSASLHETQIRKRRWRVTDGRWYDWRGLCPTHEVLTATVTNSERNDVQLYEFVGIGLTSMPQTHSTVFLARIPT